jgi:hypothetical protein
MRRCLAEIRAEAYVAASLSSVKKSAAVEGSSSSSCLNPMHLRPLALFSSRIPSRPRLSLKPGCLRMFLLKLARLLVDGLHDQSYC